MQKKRGISLIVLVITIIVMIILAAAIIISLNNTGIIGNANKAKEESDLANIKTAADLEYSEYILDKSILPEGTTIGDYITDKLVESGTIKGKNKDYYIVVSNNITYVVQVGSMVDKYYKGEIKIGDYVSYDAGENSITLNEYTGKVEENNLTPNEVTIKSTSDMKWQVLGVNGNILKLVSEDVVNPEGKTGFSLYGSYSYLKGEEILNNACSIFGKGKGATKSYSITADDINSITGYDKTKSYGCAYMVGTYDYWQVPYGTKITYKSGFSINLPFYFDISGSDSSHELVGNRKMLTRLLLQPDIDSAIDKADGKQYKKEKEVTLTQTAYVYEYDDCKDKVDANVLNMIKKSYWIANKTEELGETYIYYGIQCSNKDYISTLIMYVAGTDGFLGIGTYVANYDSGSTFSLRPVVELEANIFGTKVNNTWSLNK